MKKICVGIIGVWRIGKIHLNNLSNHLKSIEIGAISDIDEKKEKLCKDYGINKFYKSYKNLVLDKAIDASRIHLEGKNLFAEPNITLPDSKYLKHLNVELFKNKSLFFGGVNCAGVNSAIGDSRRGGVGEII